MDYDMSRNAIGCGLYVISKLHNHFSSFRVCVPDELPTLNNNIPLCKIYLQ